MVWFSQLGPAPILLTIVIVANCIYFSKTYHKFEMSMVAIFQTGHEQG